MGRQYKLTGTVTAADDVSFCLGMSTCPDAASALNPQIEYSVCVQLETALQLCCCMPSVSARSGDLLALSFALTVNVVLRPLMLNSVTAFSHVLNTLEIDVCCLFCDRVIVFYYCSCFVTAQADFEQRRRGLLQSVLTGFRKFTSGELRSSCIQ